jgi:hypothetical protein
MKQFKTFPPGVSTWCVFVDALDESAGTSDRESIATMLGHSSVRNSMPSWLRFIVTSRREPSILEKFDSRVTRLDISASDSDNRADVRDFIKLQVDERKSFVDKARAAFATAVDPMAAAVDQVARVSDGNFLVAKLSLDDVETGGGFKSLGNQPDPLTRHTLLPSSSDSEPIKTTSAGSWFVLCCTFWSIVRMTATNWKLAV